jgi:hypothetical protein
VDLVCEPADRIDIIEHIEHTQANKHAVTSGSGDERGELGCTVVVENMLCLLPASTVHTHAHTFAHTGTIDHDTFVIIFLYIIIYNCTIPNSHRRWPTGSVVSFAGAVEDEDCAL